MGLPINYNQATWQQRKEAREAYVLLQDFKCWFCGNNLYDEPTQEVLNNPLNMKLFPQNFLKYPIHLHHSHKTGMTIGAVHSRCNGYLWQYKGE